MAGKIFFRVDANKVQRDLSILSEHEIPFTAARAINRLTYGAMMKVRDRMGSVFDRPTRFTLSGFYQSKATPKSLSTSVATKDFKGENSRIGFLGTQVRGGTRDLKGFERALSKISMGQFIVPGRDCPLDLHGNIKSSTIGAVLRSLTGRIPNRQDKGRTKKLGSRVRRQQTYFVEEGRDGRPRGVFLPKARGEVAEILRFVKRPHYKQRLPADQIVISTINRRYAKIIGEEIDRTILKRKSLS